MNYFLSEEEKMIVDTARQIAQEKIKPVREKYDEEGIFPWDIVKDFDVLPDRQPFSFM